MELHPEYPVRTGRLLLRPLSAADTDALVSYRSLEEVCRFVPFEPMDAEVVVTKLGDGWSRRAITAEGEALTLGAELADTGQLIGDVMLYVGSAEHRGGEVGWVFHPDHSGRGYATEAAHAVLHLAFDQLGLHRATARVDARNDASLRAWRSPRDAPRSPPSQQRVVQGCLERRGGPGRAGRRVDWPTRREFPVVLGAADAFRSGGAVDGPPAGGDP